MNPDDPIIAAIAALVGAQNAQQTVQDRLQRPCTVTSYDSTTKRALVRIDGDTVDTSVALRSSGTPTAGARWMVSFERPAESGWFAPI